MIESSRSRLALHHRRTSPDRRSHRWWVVLGLLALSVAVGATTTQDLPGAGQEPEIIGVVDAGGARGRFRLAMPAFGGSETLAGGAGEAARTLDETLRADLADAGIFEIQGPDELAVLRLTGDPARDHELYRSLGNELLLAGDITSVGDKITLESRLIDLASGQQVLGKRYSGPFALARRIAHTLSDEVILYLTGRRGISLTDLAFHSDRNGYREVYLMDADGANQRAITAHKSISMSPDWSPQRDVISYVSYVNGRGPGLYLVDLESGSKNEVITSGSFNVFPSFSPNGDELAFARSVGGGNTEVFVTDRVGRSLRQLTRSRRIDTNPAWSPTGTKIAFTSDRSGTPQVYIMNTDGSGIERVSRSGNYNDGAAWSPDGTKLAYSSRRQGNRRFRIVLTDIVTKEERVLTSGAGSDENPSFSPDGRKIAFASEGPWGKQIFVMDVDGSQIRQVTSQGKNWAPSWSGYLPESSE